jgi:hypothetical protein
MNCWACGVEPESVYEITSFGDAEPRHLAHWPAATDHEHAERPPSPEELERSGDELLRERFRVL